MRYSLACGVAACFFWGMATAQTYDFDALKKAPGASKPVEVAKPAVRKADEPISAKPANRTPNTSPKPAGDENAFAALANRWGEQFDAEHYETADSLADTMLLSAEGPKEPRVFLGLAHRAKAMSLSGLKNPEAAIRHQEQALSIYREEGVSDEIADLEAELERYRLTARMANQAIQPEASTASLPVEEPELSWYDQIAREIPYFILTPARQLIQGAKEIAKFYMLDSGQTPLEMARTFLLIVVTSLALAVLTPWLLKALKGLLYVGMSLMRLGLLPLYLTYVVARFVLGLLVRHWLIALFLGVVVWSQMSSGIGQFSIWHWAIVAAILFFLFGTKLFGKAGIKAGR